jgi:hypothetical protein
MSELVIRALHAGEAELFLSMPDPGLVGVAMTGRSYRRPPRPAGTARSGPGLPCAATGSLRGPPGGAALTTRRR